MGIGRGAGLWFRFRLRRESGLRWSCSVRDRAGDSGRQGQNHPRQEGAAGDQAHHQRGVRKLQQRPRRSGGMEPDAIDEMKLPKGSSARDSAGGALQPRPVGSRWSMGMAVVAAVFGSMPAFLTGVMAVLMRADLGFDERGLGAAVSIFFGSAAIGSVPTGHLVDRIGAQLGLLAGVAGTTLRLVGIGLFADSWLQLVLWLVLGGLALAFTQPPAILPSPAQSGSADLARPSA